MFFSVNETASQISKIAEAVKAGRYGCDAVNIAELADAFVLLVYGGKLGNKQLINGIIHKSVNKPPAIEFVRRPPLSNLSGQACLAMITGITFSNITTLLGKKELTTVQLIGYLKNHWFLCYPALRRIIVGWKDYLEAPDFAIVRVKHPTTKGKPQWALYYDKKIYDPSFGEPRDSFYGTPTSFLRVWKRCTY